jgi:hypothetical protein
VRVFRAGVAGIAIAAVVAGSAFAAAPKKSGVYVGLIKSTPFTMKVTLNVNANGTSARFSYACGTGRAPTTIFGLAIDKTGHFKFTSNPANGQDWKMAGRFVTPSTAFVSLNSVSCGGSKGSTTLKLK